MTSIRHTDAELFRQAVLDYVIANPGASGADIVRKMGWARTTGGARLLAMVKLGELHRVPSIATSINRFGQTHHSPSFAYTALVKTTRQAKTVIAELRKMGRTVGHLPKTGKTPGIREWTARGWLNKGDDRPPIKNQEAIGSGRNRVFVGSTYNMI